ncbi:hypothetical protein EWM64_g8652, partial [Hericium alpestre]
MWIKKTNFCNLSASAYTDYIDVSAKHLFFYFFESRRDPAKDDIIIWTNRGPGAWATFSMFMENEDVAQDIAVFVALFFENFPFFKGRAFHMAGESYAGRYVPLFAAAVYDQNTALIETGLMPIILPQ